MSVSKEIVKNREIVSKPKEVQKSGIWLIGGKDSCRHNSLVKLGNDNGGNTYFKCSDCGGVIVVETLNLLSGMYS